MSDDGDPVQPSSFGRPASSRLGRWGALFLSSLKTNDPSQYAELARSGELAKVVRSVQEVAESEYRQTLQALLEKEPAPKDSNDRQAQVDLLRRQAEEIVTASVVPPNPEWARQMREGYTDENTGTWSEKPLLPKTQPPPTSPPKTSPTEGSSTD